MYAKKCDICGYWYSSLFCCDDNSPKVKKAMDEVAKNFSKLSADEFKAILEKTNTGWKNVLKNFVLRD